MELSLVELFLVEANLIQHGNMSIDLDLLFIRETCGQYFDCFIDFSKSSGEEENNGSDEILPPEQIPGPYCLPIIGSLYKYLPLGQFASFCLRL